MLDHLAIFGLITTNATTATTTTTSTGLRSFADIGISTTIGRRYNIGANTITIETDSNDLLERFVF